MLMRFIQVPLYIRDLVTVVKVVALTLFVCLATSCSKDNRQADMKQCISDVQKDVSEGNITNLSSADIGEVRHDKLGAAVSACMSKLGYSHANFDMSDQRCVDDVDFNPYCYQSGK